MEAPQEIDRETRWQRWAFGFFAAVVVAMILLSFLPGTEVPPERSGTDRHSVDTGALAVMIICLSSCARTQRRSLRALLAVLAVGAGIVFVVA